MVKQLDWSLEHQQIVIDEYPTHSTAEIAKKVGKSETQVRTLARKLGVKKTREYMAQVKKKNAKIFGQAWRSSGWQ